MFSFEGIDTCFDYCYNTRCDNIIFGPVVQLVSTPPCHGGGRRFEPDQGRLSSLKAALALKIGVLAQLGEHLPYKQGVTGSSPVGPSYILNDDDLPMWLNWQSS